MNTQGQPHSVSYLEMVVMSVTIRRELQSDVAAIDALIVSAFLHAPHTSHTEQFIVKALREAKQLSVSIVAEDSGRMIGHVAVSPVSISDGTQHWYGLGPISVAPEWQRQGVGSGLMEQALTELQKLGAAGCVVLGEPQYYGRFGFKAEPQLVLPNAPPEYFQALSFSARVPIGRVAYHEAFHAQG
jgi:putative acetyltransferase